MSRDIEERVRMFMGDYGPDLKFERLALNMSQITQYNPPENPVKSTDSRSSSYSDLYGDHCWELDALDPKVIDGIVTTAVDALRNEAKHEVKLRRQVEERGLLAQDVDDEEEDED